jgi:SAM-dependent methyltransferase
MSQSQSQKDFLFLHVRELPYFRGLLRAVESRFYQELPMPAPILDLGCGDGLFAQLTFKEKLQVGLDPWWPPIHEAVKREAYDLLAQADGARMPFPEAHFGCAISNSVLEHIPDLDQVLVEMARVLKPGAPFYFCVPSHNFLTHLTIARFFDRIGLTSMGSIYRDFFNRISRHHHCDDPEKWQARLKSAGFSLEQHWHYFSPAALAALEWGHYLGLPSLACKRLFGRWIMVPSRWNLALTSQLLRKYYDEPVPQPEGAYTFYIARRK